MAGFDREALSAAGFDGKRGQTLVIPSAGEQVFVAVGLGTGETVSTAFVRNLAASFARAVPQQVHLAVQMPASPTTLTPGEFAQAVVEGVLLARWRFFLGKGGEESLLDSLHLAAPDEVADDVREGVRIGIALARASNLGRDLANCPAATLSAERMADVAREVGPDAGLEVEAFDKEQLIEMGCGGLLGVNLGSAEPPQMIRLRYKPDATDRPARPGRQGHHVRLGRHQPQAERRVARPDEERHDRGGGGARVDVRAAGAGLHRRGDRLPDAAPTTCPPARRMQARRRADHPRRHDRGGAQHRRRGPAGDGRRRWPWRSRTASTPSSTSPPSPAPACAPSASTSPG